MKKIAAVAALVLMAGTVFAQGMPGNGPGMGMGRGPGMMAGPLPGIEWKIGTVITTEYKKVTGQLVIGQRLEPTLKADGIDYYFNVPGRNAALSDAKNGDTISLEGPVTTYKSDTKTQTVIHAFKVTVNGKETDLTTFGNRAEGPFPGTAWKAGTVVTTEYKKVTGQLIIGQKLDTVLKVDGTDYWLTLPRQASRLVDVKNGDTISVEGPVTTFKADTKLQPTIHAFKVTVNGKEIDLTAFTKDQRMGGKEHRR